MSRAFRITLVILVLGVAAGALYFRVLQRRVRELGQPAHTEERARREVTQAAVASSSDVKVKATMFWAAVENPEKLEGAEIELPLSSDPVQRAKQVIVALIALPPKPQQRTLPADATLLEFYLLPDGTAVADFSDALSGATPSGILSEQMALDSIARTLEANVPGARRLRILINGQEVETLAGHVDLSNPIELHPPEPAEPKPALTPSAPPGKL